MSWRGALKKPVLAEQQIHYLVWEVRHLLRQFAHYADEVAFAFEADTG